MPTPATPPAVRPYVPGPDGLHVDADLPLPPQMMQHAVGRLDPWFLATADATDAADKLVTAAQASATPAQHFDMMMRAILESAKQTLEHGRTLSASALIHADVMLRAGATSPVQPVGDGASTSGSDDDACSG